MTRKSSILSGVLLIFQLLPSAAFSPHQSRSTFRSSPRKWTSTQEMKEDNTDASVGGNSDLSDLGRSSCPISAALFFSSDPKEDVTRRKAFDKLLTTVSSLASHEGEGAARIVKDSHKMIEDKNSGTVHVNSLVFEVTNGDPILVIIPSTLNVDTAKVAEIMGTSVQLAPSNHVEDLCGFPPGSVPPLGHSPSVLRILVDEHLVSQDVTDLLGGGGHPDYACLLKVESLLRFEHVETSDIARFVGTVVNGDSANGADNASSVSVKPFFPIAPPSMEASEAVVPMPVTIMGRITGVRRMARRLVFADFGPPDTTAALDELFPWRSGLDGEAMAVQLIAGKTLCNALGDVEGPAALRRLRPGQLVLVKGRTNVDNPDSLQNWASKRSMDIVVCSYQIINESTSMDAVVPLQEAVSSNMQTDSEVRRLQLAASVSPAVPRVPKRIAKKLASQAATTNADYLTLNDVFGTKHDASTSSSVTIVDSLKTVNDFADEISQLLLSLTTSNNEIDGTQDGNIPGMNKMALVGVDCEWRPSYMTISPNEPQPILLLQISVQPLRRVFLFDMQELFRPLQESSETMTKLEAAASDTLLDLFSSERLLKVGFQLVADLRRLTSSYPHVTAFRVFHSVVEVSTFAKKAMQVTRTRNIRYHTNSLSRLTEFMVGRTLDKEMQVSDWASRPMDSKQIEYAALDAAVSPLLLEKSLQMAQAGVIWEKTPVSSVLQLGRSKDDSLFAGTVMSWRFLLLDSNDSRAIKKLKAKKVVGDSPLVSQRWPTGGKQPMLPSVPGQNGDGPYTDAGGVFRMPAGLVRITAGKDAATLVDHLVGERVGRSKEKCVDSLLTGEAAMPDAAKIEFHQRSGFVEFQDGVALFVNMPDKSYKRGYPNEWLDDGRVMTWYLREKEWNAGNSTLAQKLVGQPSEMTDQSIDTENAGKMRPVAVLFVRMAKGVFLCCGRCRAIMPSSHEATEPDDETMNGVSKVGDWGLLQLHLELLDWEKLQQSQDFVNMVAGKSESDTDSDGASEQVKEPAEKPATEATAMHTLAEIVLSGNIVGALCVALKQEHVPLEERSVAFGMETLINQLSDDTSQDAVKALEIVQALKQEQEH